MPERCLLDDYYDSIGGQTDGYQYIVGTLGGLILGLSFLKCGPAIFAVITIIVAALYTACKYK